ncbi:hypothetical protein M3Y99_01981300 [Aphelenchoides fujianensis]|nr:hypothetical protein M3Y99_01981300 [Aphelenchoides fujianensis]
MINPLVVPPNAPPSLIGTTAASGADRPAAATALCDPHTTLWMGDINPAWTSEYITNLYREFGFNIRRVKLVFEKGGGNPASFCFVEFMAEEDARQAMLQVNGLPIPNDPDNHRFNLSFANNPDSQNEYSLYVNNLHASVDDAALFKLFGEKYKTCRGAKVYRLPDGSSKELGFVRFSSETDQQMALVEMNKIKLKGKELQLRLAHPRGRFAPRGRPGHFGNAGPAPAYGQPPFSTNNTFGRPGGHFGRRDDHGSYRGNRGFGFGRGARRSRSPHRIAAPTRSTALQPVDPPNADDYNELAFQTDAELREALDFGRYSKCLLPVDVKHRDLGAKIFELTEM